MNRPSLILIGAGPGDPELISVKGLKALQKAKVILYDALAHPGLLDETPKDALKVFVGKKKGVCQFKQEDINDLIVQYAQSHGEVIRLKGGDPFIFGRGHEEALHAQAHGLDVIVIPGISSSYSVPELCGIPLTRRGINESFFVVTGTTRDHELSKDVLAAAQSSATLVILMGMTQLYKIVEVFTREGKRDLPVAIIQNGSLKEERLVLGQLHNIQQRVAEQQISSPAVIVIGEVVTLHPLYSSYISTLHESR